MAEYPDNESYIKGEYGEVFPVVEEMVRRHVTSGGYTRNFKTDTLEHHITLSDKAVEALVLDIVGYFTGCRTAIGDPRVKNTRRPSRDPEQDA